MALIIGLTGGIASGKSTIANMLKNEGITVIDADVESRLAVEQGEEAYDHIVNHFSKRFSLKMDPLIEQNWVRLFSITKKSE